MAIDVRAKVYALLEGSTAPVSIVQGSVADESVSPGQAIIRCRGQLIVEGSRNVARGDRVRISYIKEDRLYTLPRTLYALSSFIDPFRKTTVIQLGDKLVLNENLRPSSFQLENNPLFPEDAEEGDTFQWPLPYENPDPDSPDFIEYTYNGICWEREPETVFWKLNSNQLGLEEIYAGLTAAVAAKVPLTIPASAILLKCLAGLGLVRASGVVLSLHYEQGQISLEGGYLNALEQILSAEGYVGYIDTEGSFRVARPITSSNSLPLLTKTALIDIGPGDLGPLPIPPDEEDVEPGEPGEEPDNTEPEPPIARNFSHETIYEKDADAFINFSEFEQNTQIDQAFQTTKTRGDFQVITAASSEGDATIDLENGWVKVDPPHGFVGTIQLAYAVNDGFNTSGGAFCYIAWTESLPPPPPPPGGPAKPLGGETFEFQTGSEIETKIDYNNPDDGSLSTQTYTHSPRSSTQEIYGSYGEVTYRWEEAVSGGAATAGNVFKLHLEAGLVPTSSEARIITTTTFEYRYENAYAPECKLGAECPPDIDVPESPAPGDIVTIGNCNYAYTDENVWVSSGDTPDPQKVVSVNGKSILLSELVGNEDAKPLPALQITRVYESLYHIAGAINWPELDIAVPPMGPETLLVEEVYTQYSNDAESGASRTLVTRYTARYKLTEGQQYLAELRNTYDTFSTQLAVNNRYLSILNYATQLIFNNAETTLRGDRSYGAQIAPMGDKLFPGVNEGTTGGTGSLTPKRPLSQGAPGSTEPEPKAPVVLDENGQAIKDYEAWQLANRQTAYRWYVRTFNALANGSRYGMALELAPFGVPLNQLQTFALNIDGVVAVYRNNGLSFAFDSNGIILSNDALLVGGAGFDDSVADPGEQYFPTAPNYSGLQPISGGSPVPEYEPPYSAPLPEDFDPETDLGTVTDSAGSNTSGGTEQVIDVDGVIPIEPLITTVRAGLRIGMTYKKFEYSLLGTSTDQAVGVVVGIAAQRVKLVPVPAAAITLAAGAPAVSIGAATRPPVALVTIAALGPAISAGVSVAVPVANIAVAPATGPIVPRDAIVFTPPTTDIAVSAIVPAVVGGASVAVPAGDIAVAAVAPTTSITVPPVFKVVTYTGNGSTLTVSGLNFEPSVVWTKRRSGATGDHVVYDNVRGTTKYWRPSNSGAEVTSATTLTSFDSDGFTLGSSTVSNVNTAPYVAWCWPDLGSAASNIDGTITTSVATSAGMGLSIFTYTGNGSSGATVGHGLGEEPDFVIVKNLGASSTVAIAGSPLLAANSYLNVFGNNASASNSAYLQGYSSTTVTLGTINNTNANTNTYVGYAFVSVTNKSKINTYSGTGTTDNSITTGFTPSFVLIKSLSIGDWMYFDTARGATEQLIHTTAVATTVDKITFDANGFTVKANQNTNTNAQTFLYMAFL